MWPQDMSTNFGGADTMQMLFDQAYATEVYTREQVKIGKIENTVDMLQEFGVSMNDAIHRLAVKFGLSQEEATEYVHEFWRS